MPKIRIKHLKDTQLEKYLVKSYETIEGITTLTTSGVLNSNNKKVLNDKFNHPAKFNVELLDSSGEGKYKNIDPFNDNHTLSFLTFNNNNTVLGLPAIKLEGKNDFYITTDDYFLNLNEIPTEHQSTLNENFIVSNSLIQTPNYVDLRNFQKNTVASPKIINQNQIKSNAKTTEYSPFIENSLLDNLSDEFINDSIVYENETYNVGDQQTINLVLDFSESEAAHLLNTTLFYKSGRKFNDLDNSENILPDAVFATSQVNFTNLTTPMSITSNFLPNVLWNNIDKRWEYNVIDYNENLHLSTYRYNYNNNNQSFFYPNAITNLHNFDITPNESLTVENTFKIIHNYIENSPICFTESYDRFNYLIDNPSLTKYNTITDTYGFPNSSLWKTNPSHSIKLENYLPGDFLVEKIIFEGNLDIKAEIPTKKGNYFNNLQTNQDYGDSILYTTLSEYNQEFSHNQNNSNYIISTINFYLARVNKSNSISSIPKINGYQIKNNESTLSLSDYVLEQSDNAYIDTALSDLSGKYYYDDLPNDYNLGDIFKENQRLVYKPIKNSVFESLKIDEYNNVTKNRKTRKFFYLSDLNSPIDLSNNSYMSIVSDTDYQTDVYADLNSNSVSKQLIETEHTDFNNENNLDLITHNSISFVKTKSNSIKNSIDLNNINSDVIVDIEPGTNLNIDIDNYDFKIGNKLNKNELINNNISESVFGITSNYQYSEIVPEVLQTNILFYNFDYIKKLFYVMREVNSGLFDETPDNSYLLGMPAEYFIDYSGLHNNTDGDINIEFTNFKSETFYTAKVQLNYNNAINEASFSLDDFIKSVIDIDFSLTKVNIAVLENNEFVSYLINKTPSFNTEGVELNEIFRNDLRNRQFESNQNNIELYNELVDYLMSTAQSFNTEGIQLSESFSSDLKNAVLESNQNNIIFYSLSLDMQALCFVKLLDITLLNTKHAIDGLVGQEYYPFTKIRRHEADENSVRLLINNINKSFGYSSELILNEVLNNNYNISYKVPLRLRASVLGEFSIPAESYDYKGSTYTSDAFSGNFYRIFYENISSFSDDKDIQGLDVIRYYEDPITINKGLEEEIGILNSSYKNKSKRILTVLKKRKEKKNDNISRSGKLISKSGDSVYKENLSYILKKNDEIVIGMNSFAGFNNLISYSKINKKLHITLIGRELHKKKKNASSENINTTNAIIGSQRNEVLLTNNKVLRLSCNKKKYISDTILPGIGKIYNEILNKDVLTSNTDSFDLFINRDSFDRIKTNNELKSNRIIFTTRSRDNAKYSNVVNDWHKNYYLSKNRSILNNKEIENSQAYFANKTNIKKSFVFFDINSYAFNKKYSELLSTEITKMNSEIGSITNLSFTPCNFILPRDFEYSVFNTEKEVVEKSMQHPGIKIKYINDDSNANYTFTKDATSKIINNVKAFDIIAKTDIATLQYLTVPERCVDSYNIDDISFSNVNNFANFRNSWCLVVTQPNLSVEFTKKFFEFVKDTNKIDFYQKVDDNNKIYYDETFKLVGVPKETEVYPTYLHNFYVVTYDDVINQIIIPISFLENKQNTLNNLSDNNTLNVVYNIDYSLIDKTFYQNPSDSENVYNKIPYDVSGIINLGANSSTYLLSRNRIDSDFEFYLPAFELLYPQNESLKNIIKDAMSKVIYEKLNNNTTNKIKEGYFLSFYDKKVFTFSTEYLALRELIKNNKKLSDGYYLNKKINSTFIFKKNGNHYIRTQNKLLYQISNKEVYNNESVTKNSYVDCFGIERNEKFSNSDIRCMLVYDVKENDTIRIYDDQFKSQIGKLDKNYRSPYIEIDLSIKNPATNETVIKYSHYSLDYDDASNKEYLCYGSPICDVSNKEVTNKFIYSYSNNKKYHYPIDKTSGYRYGVYNPNPVKQSVTFNTNHYGLFKDKTYDTQNYSTVETINGQKFYKYTTFKRYVSDNFRFINEETASTLSVFEGTNLDIYNRHYYPFVESTDGSDMSGLYLA